MRIVRYNLFLEEKRARLTLLPVLGSLLCKINSQGLFLYPGNSRVLDFVIERLVNNAPDQRKKVLGR